LRAKQRTGKVPIMCRFAVRQPGGAQPPAAQEHVKLEAPLDLDSLFEQGADDLDANGGCGGTRAACYSRP